MELPHLKEYIPEENYNKIHNAKPLPQLYPGQDILFLLPGKPNTYLHGTIMSPVSIPKGYTLESQGSQYCRTWQHIHPLNCDTATSISRPHFESPATQISVEKPEDSTTKTTTLSQISRPQASKCTITPSKQTATSCHIPPSQIPRPCTANDTHIERPFTLPHNAATCPQHKTINPYKHHTTHNKLVFSPSSSCQQSTSTIHSDPESDTNTSISTSTFNPTSPTQSKSNSESSHMPHNLFHQ